MKIVKDFFLPMMYWIRVLSFVVVTSLGALPALADPETWKAEGWNLTDFGKTAIPWTEIKSGGPPKDGIPSIDQPLFQPVAETKDLAAKDPVISVEIADDARAYPLRVMIWHEIVNDTIGGVPVTVTYCPLCNAAITFDRRVNNRVLDFGTTGKLRNSDLVMYDRQTESWWQQFTGEAIVGEMTGTALRLLPARLESFADFKSRHPGGKVLIPNNPTARDYGSNPYIGYDSSSKPFLYQGDLPEGIEPMERVVVARLEQQTPVIVSLSLLRKIRTLRDGAFEFSWKPGQSSAVDEPTIAEGRDVGTVEVYRISPSTDRELVPYDVTFAFVAHAFHPDIKIRQHE
jgi:hypothetical protein